MAKQPLLFFLFLILLTIPSSSLTLLSSASFSQALDVLSASGYLSMALTLEITSGALKLGPKPVTVFAPWDPAFARSGRPTLAGLQYHILPMRLTSQALKSLPFGSTIPTLLPNHSLMVTTASGLHSQLSINGVLVQESEIFDNGVSIFYGIKDFFNLSFVIPYYFVPSPSPSATRGVVVPVPPSSPAAATGVADPPSSETSGPDIDPFGQSSTLLRGRGYSIVSMFLDAQLLRSTNETNAKFTIFALVDGAMKANAKDLSDYALLFRKHVVRGLFPMKDLAGMKNGTKLPTLCGGFSVNVTKSGHVVVVNDFLVIFPDMYLGGWLIVHGLNQLPKPAMEQELLSSEANMDLFRYDEYGLGP